VYVEKLPGYALSPFLFHTQKRYSLSQNVFFLNYSEVHFLGTDRVVVGPHPLVKCSEVCGLLFRRRGRSASDVLPSRGETSVLLQVVKLVFVEENQAGHFDGGEHGSRDGGDERVEVGDRHVVAGQHVRGGGGGGRRRRGGPRGRRHRRRRRRRWLHRHAARQQVRALRLDHLGSLLLVRVEHAVVDLVVTQATQVDLRQFGDLLKEAEVGTGRCDPRRCRMRVAVQHVLPANTVPSEALRQTINKSFLAVC